MPLASRSARCSGLERSARIPPWILGWRVLTRPPSISGDPVTSATSVCAMPASLSLAAVLPLATSSHPRSDRPWASSTRPSLSYTDSRALTTSSPRPLLFSDSSGPDAGPHRPHGPAARSPVPPPARRAPRPRWPGYKVRSTTLIRSCSVSSVSPGRTGTTSWARIGPASISRVARCTVHPVSGTPAARASRTPCQPGNAGSRAGCVLRIRSGKARWTASGQHRAEAGHGHQVDLVGHQGGRHGGREAVPVEFRPEATVPGPVDQLGGGTLLLGQGEGGTGPVRQDDADREARLEHRPQDRPGTRDKDREAHGVNLMRGRLTPGGRVRLRAGHLDDPGTGSGGLHHQRLRPDAGLRRDRLSRRSGLADGGRSTWEPTRPESRTPGTMDRGWGWGASEGPADVPRGGRSS